MGERTVRWLDAREAEQLIMDGIKRAKGPLARRKTDKAAKKVAKKKATKKVAKK